MPGCRVPWLLRQAPLRDGGVSLRTFLNLKYILKYYYSNIMDLFEVGIEFLDPILSIFDNVNN